MKIANKHPKEALRLKELQSYSILDSLPEKDYDNLTAIAAEICESPISLVTLLDDNRQWFKSHHGLSISETPIEVSFCSHTIVEDKDILIVQDSRCDDRFKENPFVTADNGIVFYAGVPLVSPKGLPLGTICVADNKPKELSTSQVASLKALASQVMNLLELRKKNELLKDSMEALEDKNKELERFAYIAAHDLKSPLNNISALSMLLQDSYGKQLDDEGQTMLGYINSSSETLKGLVDGLLEYSKSASVLDEEITEICVKDIKEEILSLFSYQHTLEFNVHSSLKSIFANRTAIDQILINLIANAIKYNDKNKTKIELHLLEDDEFYEFRVQDNGPGIAVDDQKKIFEIFTVLKGQDKDGKKGHGIGLATVKKMVEHLGGTIHVQSNMGEGTSFNFKIAKSGQMVATFQ